jgi:hypothetical protein
MDASQLGSTLRHQSGWNSLAEAWRYAKEELRNANGKVTLADKQAFTKGWKGQANPSKQSLLKKLRKGIRGTVKIVRGRLLINPGGSAAGAGAGGAGGGAGAGSQGGRSSTEVRSPTRTSTSTEAETYGNVTVTGGAGAGANTNVRILKNPSKLLRKGIRGTVSIRNGRLIIKT